MHPDRHQHWPTRTGSSSTAPATTSSRPARCTRSTTATSGRKGAATPSCSSPTGSTPAGMFEFKNLMPRFPIPDGYDSEDALFADAVWQGMAKRYPSGYDEQRRAQAEYEISIICQMGFPAYFLVVADFINWAKNNGVAVGPGRGSAAGSIVAYADGHHRPGPAGPRADLRAVPEPRAHLDARHRHRLRRARPGRRHQVRHAASGAATRSRRSSPTARSRRRPPSRTRHGSSASPTPSATGSPRHSRPRSWARTSRCPASSTRATTATTRPASCGTLYETEPEVKQIIDTARGIEGLIRQPGVHAAGVIMSAEPLTDHIPVWTRYPDRAVITQFDYPTCESLGLLKMDFLGLRNLTIMSDAVKAIEQNRGITIDLLGLPLTDQPTYDLLSRGDTLGVFQFDGSGYRTLLRLLKPDNFEDISALGALYRPGPMGVNSPHQLRPAQERPAADHPDPSRARRAAAGGARADLRPGRLPGAGAEGRPGAGRVHAGTGRPAPARDGQEEEGDPGQGVRPVP